MPSLSSLLWRHLRVYTIYGANTDVGKTVVATALCASASRHGHETGYLKPVSTGPETESDSLCKATSTLAKANLLQRGFYAGDGFMLTNHSQMSSQGTSDPLVHVRRQEADSPRHVTQHTSSIAAKTLVQYDIPCSPHKAAKAAGEVLSDSALRAAIVEHANECAKQGKEWLFIETAGGVLSPGPSGTPQADLYAPLRSPVVLVGDCRLGGISQTVSAFESLKIRGTDVVAVLMFRDEVYENHTYLQDYFQKHDGTPLITLEAPPERHEDSEEDRNALRKYYRRVEESSTMTGVTELLHHHHKNRLDRLDSMSTIASRTIWYPFTQQKLLTPERISVIDSAYGDDFQVLKKRPLATEDGITNQKDVHPLLEPAFDGSASWWTQGLGHGNPRLALAAAYAAGRYGHVMFAEAIHEPALALAETLLKGMKNPRLSRAFFTDNGSTGCEVAVKMALRASRKRYGWAASDKIEILGLKGSYHGDTIGTMDCSEPSVFNEKVEWYQGKGFWFDYPSVWLRNGRWVLDMPQPLHEQLGSSPEFDKLDDIFDIAAREERGTHQVYKNYFRVILDDLRARGRRFGALMLEPIVLGAGGMILVDPLYQKALVDVVRESPELFGPSTQLSDVEKNTAWSGLPVVFDEVFTGLYRLGRFSSSSFMKTEADISVHAKLLTGGLVPLSITLASVAVFDAFSSEDKSDALLHGHSYTAHAVGCQVALESVKELQQMEQGGCFGKHDEQEQRPSTMLRRPWSVWPSSFLEALSRQSDRINGVWALGSVLTISMQARDGAGYNSKAAANLQSQLRGGDRNGTVHSRVLGNVIYIMASQKTDEMTVQRLQDLLKRLLGI